MTSTIRILHVDDEPEFAKLATEFLTDENDRFEVTTATSVAEGLDRIDGEVFDCIISDYEMPKQDGIAFLETVREEHPELPFILFTGKGNEEIASNAISAGVTDYLQKGTSRDRYTLLANRIVNVVEKYHTQTALERSENRYRTLIERAPIPIIIYSTESELIHINDAGVEFFNASTQEDLLGRDLYEFTHPDNDAEVRARVNQMLADTQPVAPSQQQIVALDGEIKHAIVVSAPIQYDGEQAIQTIAYDITERVEHEQQLKHERSRFKRLFDTLPEPTAIISGRGGLEIKAVNPAFEDTFGYEEADILGENLNDLIVPPEFQEEAEQIDDIAIEGEILREEVERETADGRRRNFLMLATGEVESEFDETAEGFVIYADITDRKRREEVLKTLHDIATEITTLQEPIPICERAVDAAELVLDFDNCAVLLKEDDRLSITAISDAYQIDDTESLSIEGTIAGETYRTGESMIINDVETAPKTTPNGPYRGFLSIPIGEHGVFQVVSETPGAFDEADLELAELLVTHIEQGLDRIERERDFRETNRRLQAVLDTVSAAILVKDTDDRYILMNRTGREWSGIPETADITKYTTADLFPSDITEEIRAEDRHILETGKTHEIEEEMPLADDTKPLLTYKSPIYDETGEPYGICSVSTDITEQKKREEELRRQNERLEEFTKIVSHDLRNPLNILEGSLDLAEETGDTEEFDRCRRAIDRMNTLIEDLLTLARQGETVGEMETVSLADRATSAWRNVATETARLDTEAAGALLAAPDRLEQLLENLFRNAIEHGGGDVLVSVGDLEGGFYVEDDGEGIPQAAPEEVFETGYSTAADGTGFGLTIVKEIVEAHEWTIDVTDGEAGGARFEIRNVETPSETCPDG